MRSYYRILPPILFAVPLLVFGQDIPTGTTVTSVQILVLMKGIGGFLIIAGSILVGISIIISGLIYMLAGSNQQRVTSAKNMLKASIIGALVMFSVGAIITTITNLASNPVGFFSGGSGGGGGGNACLGCVNSGQTWCLANSSCLSSPTSCPGTFTQVPAGCP